jgi:hypothetical protein
MEKCDKLKSRNFSQIYAHNGWNNTNKIIPKFAGNDPLGWHSIAASVSIVQTETKIKSLTKLYDDIAASHLIAGFNLSYAHE